MVHVKNAGNPFDFANPVHNMDLLAGREDQLREARYYIEQLALGGTVTNLALLGERAAGKTSLLNAIEQLATKHNHVVARIDLTEGDVATPLHFWFKAFDQAFSAAVENGAFGGVGSPFYDAYLNMVSGHNEEVPTEYRIFRSAELFGHLAHQELHSTVVHESLIRKDLKLLLDEIDGHLILLFDECDVLANNQALLQQFRNVFMPMDRCMIVIAATPDLFPAMSDTYSPIIRQFKSVAVGAFENLRDVRSCITQRLELVAKQLGIEDVEDRSDVMRVAQWTFTEEFEFANEVHEASGGLPHQVQLLCHLAFRKYQRGETDRLTLSLEVLEEATREIGLTDSADTRPLHRAISDLNEDLRNALDHLGRCSGKATLEQLSIVAAIADPECDWSADAGSRRLQRLTEVGLLRQTESGQVEFCGDSLDRVYGRLFARLRGERLNIGSYSLEEHFAAAVRERVRKSCLGSSYMWSRGFSPARYAAMRRTLLQAGSHGWSGVEMDVDSFAAIRSLRVLVGDPGDVGRCARVVMMRASSDWCETSAVVGQFEDEDTNFVRLQVAVESAANLEREISGHSGGQCQIEVVDIDPIPATSWEQWVLAFGSPSDREGLAREKAGEGVTAYIDGDEEAAIALFRSSIELARLGECLSNLGYVLLKASRIEEALDVLTEGAAADPHAGLVNYNYALCLLLSGDAARSLDVAKDVADFDDSPTAVMLLPIRTGTGISVAESTEDAPSTVAAALALIDFIADS